MRPLRSHDYYGWAVGVQYRELIGTRWLGLTLGWAFPSRYVMRSWLDSIMPF